jgi:hypothetical protein
MIERRLVLFKKKMNRGSGVMLNEIPSGHKIQDTWRFRLPMEGILERRFIGQPSSSD